MNKSQIKLFLKFLRYLLAYRKKYAGILALSLVTTLLGISIPYISKLVVDRALIDKNMRQLIFFGLIGTAVFIANNFLRALIRLLSEGIHLKVRFDLHKKILMHLQKLPLSFFQNTSTGEHLFKIDYDIENLVSLIVSVPTELIIFPKFFFIIGIIFYFDWQLALFTLCFTPIIYIPVYYFTRRIRKTLKESITHSQGIFERLEEMFSHIYLVKAFAKEKSEIINYLKKLIANTRINYRRVKQMAVSNFVEGSCNRIIIGLISLFGCYHVIVGKINLGTLAAILLYLNQLVTLQQSIVTFGRNIAFKLVSYHRLAAILEAQPLVSGANQKVIYLKNPRLEFKNVDFGYRSQEHILKDFSFTIEKGFTALAGPSGCGKTTILNLILKLYTPWAGDIYIESIPLSQLNEHALRKQIGVALQKPFLFNDSIANNIRYAKPEATADEVMRYARYAGVDEFVNDLADGYTTIIGENACKLSEGQKQKIAIARALIKNPQILILDEAMSSMDSLSEEKIISCIKQLPIQMTIIVSHRLSTVMACDYVCFLKNQETITTGNPHFLLENEKALGELFAGQLLSEIHP